MTIVLIPPSGKFKKQDFSIERISYVLKMDKEIKTVLVHIGSESGYIKENLFDETIFVNSEDELFASLQNIKYDYIFHRAWMHSYQFAKILVEKFDNVLVNIKDWNFCSKAEYEFLFGNTEDFEAIEYIFKNSKKVLSHFTKEQAFIWAEEYDIDSNKFIFFPEYCNKEFFCEKDIKYKGINLVYAGKIHKTVYPEQLFPAKSHLRSILRLTKQGFNVDYVLPEKEYEHVMNNKECFLDFLYEDRFNEKFQLIKGEKLSADILNKYHFGFFELEVSGKNKELFKYAIVSKFAFYLEASLPILVNQEFVSISKIVKKHNLGIVFSNENLDDFHNLVDISQVKYDDFVDKIKKYRESYTYDDRLKSLFKDL